MSFVLSPLVYQLGIGGIGGFLAGYAIKKISKLILVLIGLLVFFLFYLGTRGIISINYEELWNSLAGMLGFAGQAATWLIGLIALFPALGSFAAGFLIGLKIG
jgi:uncharacterized membrane protein (Fun14 family)